MHRLKSLRITKNLSSERVDDTKQKNTHPFKHAAPELHKSSHPHNTTTMGRLDELHSYERCSFESIKSTWNENREQRSLHDSYWVDAPINSRWVSESGFSDEMILRFARCSNFDSSAALKAMTNMNLRFLTLTCANLETQLRTKTLFIPSGLKSRDGCDTFYMRPARFFPGIMEVDGVIDNLAYCMQTMFESETCCKKGIAFLAYMSGWTQINFSLDYCRRFMTTIQGYDLPVKVTTFLIVDPPKWFGKIWKIMKTMLSPDFKMRVHLISSNDLHMYLEEGYKKYLPDEMDQGMRPTDDIITEFIHQRIKIEGSTEKSAVNRVHV